MRRAGCVAWPWPRSSAAAASWSPGWATSHGTGTTAPSFDTGCTSGPGRVRVEGTAVQQHSETIEISGHLMDSGVLARILDDVLEYGGDYVIDRMDVGKTHDDESYARIDVVADTEDGLARLLMRLQTHGANMVEPGEVLLRPAEQDGVFPDDFYSTTNLETVVRLGGHWVPVEHPEMDCGLVISDGRVRTIPVSDVKAG